MIESSASPISCLLRPRGQFKASVDRIARVAHEANRAYRISIGEDPGPDYDSAPAHMVASAKDGVEKILTGEVTHPRQSHESWLAFKAAAGWTYGAVKDEAAKTHPCILPYDELPLEQRNKDHLFFGIIMAFMQMSLS